MFDNVIIGGSLCAYATAAALKSIGQKYVIIESRVNDNASKSYKTEIDTKYGIPIVESIGYGGGSKVWHGVIAKPLAHEIENISNLAIEDSSFNFAAALLSHDLKDLYSVEFNHSLLNRYLTPYSPLSTKKWLNTEDLILGFVDRIEKLNNSTRIYFQNNTCLTAKKVYLCLGAIQTYGLLARSGLLKDSIAFADHVGFPVGVIPFNTAKSWFYDKNDISSARKCWSKFALQTNKARSIQIALFLRPTTKSKLDIRQEKIRQTIVAIRSGKVSLKVLIQALASFDTLIKLIYLKWNRFRNPKYLEVYAVSTQNLLIEKSTLSKSGKSVKLQWSPSISQLTRSIIYINGFLNKIYGKKFLHYNVNDILNVSTGSAHISGTALDALSNDGVQLAQIKNVYVCGSAAFKNPIVENNTLTAMALSVQAVKYSHKL